MLMVGFPMYHTLPVPFFAGWLAMDKSPVMGTTVVNGAYIEIAMTSIVTETLKVEGWDRLVIMEHDMVPSANAFLRMNAYAPEVDVVGSMYFRHEEPYQAVVYVEHSDTTHGAITPQTVKDWCDTPGLYPCDGVGFGLTSMSRRCLEAWDPDIPMFNLDNHYGSHDLWFCHHAREQGFNVSVDSGIVCDHLTQHKPIGLSHNQSYYDSTDYSQVVVFNKQPLQGVSNG